MVKAISAKEGYRILRARGLDANDDCQRTFFALDEDKQEVYEFNTKMERDNFVRRHEMTDKEKAIIKGIKSQVRKHYGKWCIKRVDVEIVIARALYGEKYGKDMWRFQMNDEEKADADKVFEGMMKRGLIRYTTQPRRCREAGGSINYHMNMIVEKKFWDLYNQIKEA